MVSHEWGPCTRTKEVRRRGGSELALVDLRFYVQTKSLNMVKTV